MASFLDQIKDLTQNMISSGKEAAQWYKEKTKGLYDRDQNKLFKKTSLPTVGQIYLFAYDPKLKSKLPFYDAYPLVIPIEYYNDGFLGLNLHYLPPMARISLLEKLMTISNQDKYDEKTKLSVSYDVLRYAARNTNYKVCLKRYLFGHVRSSYHEVNPTDWKKVIVMPLQKWEVNPNRKLAGSPPY